jgi:hypothetical protein
LVTFFLSISFLILLKDIFSVVKNFIFSLSDLLKKIKKPDWSKELGFMNEIKTEFFDFIKNNKRKVYGGYAVNQLLVSKGCEPIYKD